MSGEPGTVAGAHHARSRPIAGFWRRLAAAAGDSALLGAFGLCLGLIWFGELAQLGGSGRLLGGSIALAYLGTLNSGVGRGRTLGKRLVGRSSRWGSACSASAAPSCTCTSSIAERASLSTISRRAPSSSPRAIRVGFERGSGGPTWLSRRAGSSSWSRASVRSGSCWPAPKRIVASRISSGTWRGSCRGPGSRSRTGRRSWPLCKRSARPLGSSGSRSALPSNPTPTRIWRTAPGSST